MLKTIFYIDNRVNELVVVDTVRVAINYAKVEKYTFLLFYFGERCIYYWGTASILENLHVKQKHRISCPYGQLIYIILVVGSEFSLFKKSLWFKNKKIIGILYFIFFI